MVVASFRRWYWFVCCSGLGWVELRATACLTNVTLLPHQAPHPGGRSSFNSVDDAHSRTRNRWRADVRMNEDVVARQADRLEDTRLCDILLVAPPQGQTIAIPFYWTMPSHTSVQVTLQTHPKFPYAHLLCLYIHPQSLNGWSRSILSCPNMGPSPLSPSSLTLCKSHSSLFFQAKIREKRFRLAN